MEKKTLTKEEIMRRLDRLRLEMEKAGMAFITITDDIEDGQACAYCYGSDEEIANFLYRCMLNSERYARIMQTVVDEYRHTSKKIYYGNVQIENMEEKSN